MAQKRLVIALSVVFLVLLGFLYSRMGGDFVIQPVLKTGTSLSKTIETTTKIERILLKKFPEVKRGVQNWYCGSQWQWKKAMLSLP